MFFKHGLKCILLEITIVILTPKESYENDIRYCYFCKCTDCELPKDSWCISPISNYLARDQFIELGRTDSFNASRKRRKTGGRKHLQSKNYGWCSILTWDEKLGNRWGKVCSGQNRYSFFTSHFFTDH